MVVRRRGWVSSPEHEALVAVLVQAREEAGLTQRDLAERMGVDQPRIAKIERRQRNVSVLELIDFALAFDLDPRDLFGRILAVSKEKVD